MNTSTVAPASEATPPGSPPPTGPGAPARPWAGAALLLAVLAAVVGVFFLRIYPVRGYTVPVGWDQSEYLWRTTMAQAVGLSNIDRPLPSTAAPKSGRPGFPVIAGTLSSLTRASTFRVAMVLPAVMAVIVGMAAGAFVGVALRRSWWQVAVVALAVSLSPFMVRLMQPEGYLDNLFAAAVFMAATLALSLAIRHRAALVPTVVLLAAGATVHWDFFLFMAAVLLLCGGLLLPASWRRWRSGQAGLLDTPTARIGEGLLGGAVVGAGMIFGVLGNSLPHVREDVSEFAKKVRLDLPKYRFAVTIPAAAVGAAGLADEARRGRRDQPLGGAGFALAFLAAWCGVAVAGFLAWKFLHLAIPAHRFLAFALSVPILGILGVLWVVGLVRRRAGERSGAGISVSALLVVVALAWTAVVSSGLWMRARTWTDPSKLKDAAIAEAYLEAAHVPADRPVVFIMAVGDWNGAGLNVHMMRAALPASRIQQLYVYDGSAEAYVSGQPLPNPISRGYFDRVRPVLARDPVVLILSAYGGLYFDQWAQAHPTSVVQGEVAVVQGPPPPSNVPSPGPPVGPPIGPINSVKLAALAALILAALGLAGLGWTLAMLGRWLRPVEVLALAPAVGVGVLVLGGIMVDRLGFRLVGATGALTPIAVAVAGFGAWAVVATRRRRLLANTGAD